MGATLLRTCILCEEYGSIDNRFDDDGNRLEEYEDEFCMIVDDVEEILGIFLKRRTHDRSRL